MISKEFKDVAKAGALTATAGMAAAFCAVAAYYNPADVAPLAVAGVVAGLACGASSVELVDRYKSYKGKPRF